MRKVRDVSSQKVIPIAQKGSCIALGLSASQRKSLALKVLARTESVTNIAAKHGVSRKFLYQQSKFANFALDEAFAQPSDDQAVLFYLPVTMSWIKQLVLALILICHSSYRGVIELLRDLFDIKLSIGSIHNIVIAAVEKAQEINSEKTLEKIHVGCHDEIFQANKPVLVGIDWSSTYCYLLTAAEHRDSDTWGWHLLDLKAKGLDPDYTIADGGKGLRAGQAAAWSNTPCHGDVFHILRQFGQLVFFLERRANGAITSRDQLEAQMKRAKKKACGHTLSKKLALARQKEKTAIQLAEDVEILFDWMKNDVLALAGDSFSDRQLLFNFIVSELVRCESKCPHRIRPVRIALSNQQSDLLAFAEVLDKKLVDIAERFQTPLKNVRAVCQLLRLSQTMTAYWQKWTQLQRQLPGKFHQLEEAVREAMQLSPRASSLVENLNSRLRNYFFLRRQLGSKYLDLLRFFLNHRTFMRSECPERVGKSPTELMTGQKHPHWLELLGFERFQRA